MSSIFGFVSATTKLLSASFYCKSTGLQQCYELRLLWGWLGNLTIVYNVIYRRKINSEFPKQPTPKDLERITFVNWTFPLCHRLIVKVYSWIDWKHEKWKRVFKKPQENRNIVSLTINSFTGKNIKQYTSGVWSWSEFCWCLALKPE